MEILLLAFLLVLNFGVSWWNAHVSGKAWLETKSFGGWMHVITWAGVVMSAAGFTMCIGFVVGGLAFAFHLLPAAAFSAFTGLIYLMIILPILGSGIIIMIESWVRAYKERDFTSVGFAAWNTFAMAHNSYQAFDGGISSVFKSVTNFFSSDDEDDTIKTLVIGIALGALVGGCLLTYAIMKDAMASMPLPVRNAVRN